jgi:hypothetical protein
LVISPFWYADQQNATHSVREHADIEQKFALAVGILGIQFAFVVQLEVFFQSRLDETANINLANVT